MGAIKKNKIKLKMSEVTSEEEGVEDLRSMIKIMDGFLDLYIK